jgi:hypothetical protein
VKNLDRRGFPASQLWVRFSVGGVCTMVVEYQDCVDHIERWSTVGKL